MIVIDVLGLLLAMPTLRYEGGHSVISIIPDYTDGGVRQYGGKYTEKRLLRV